MIRANHRLVSVAVGLAMAWPGVIRAAPADPDPTGEEAQPTSPSAPAQTEAPETPTETPEVQAPDAEAPSPETPASEASDPTALTPEQLHEREQEFNFAEGRRHFNEGERLHHAGRYAEAAVEFERSHAAWPAASTLYNIALSYERAGKAVEAVRALERYLALTDCNALPADQRTIECASRQPDARKALEQQRRRVGELTLKIAEGVELREVRVAGRVVPLDDFPLLMLPGTVDVELYGMGPDDRRTRPAYITAGEAYEVYVAPFESATVVEPPVPEIGPEVDDPLRREQRRRALRVTFWTGVGLTAASGIALGVMGGLSRYHARRYGIEKCRAECYELDEDGTPVVDQNGDYIPLNTGYPLDHEQAFERYKPVANALVGVTIGLAVGTALVGAFAFRKRAETAEPGPSETARVRVHLGAPGLVVRW